MDKSHDFLLLRFEDEAHPQLQCSAIAELGVEYKNSGDRKLLRALANLVKNESAHTDVRMFAYVNLFIVSKRGIPDYPKLKGFVFPQDVDWPFVNSFIV